MLDNFEEAVGPIASTGQPRARSQSLQAVRRKLPGFPQQRWEPKVETGSNFATSFSPAQGKQRNLPRPLSNFTFYLCG